MDNSRIDCIAFCCSWDMLLTRNALSVPDELSNAQRGRRTCKLFCGKQSQADVILISLAPTWGTFLGNPLAETLRRVVGFLDAHFKRISDLRFGVRV
jgi:hypothetical protein